MREKFKIVEKSVVMDNLRQISNNVMVISFMENLINHGSITNFFYKDGKYLLESENIRICIDSKHISIYNNLDGNNQEFDYYINEDGSSVTQYKSYMKIDKINFMEIRNVSITNIYDNCGNLVKSDNIMESYLSSTDEEVMKKLKDKRYENYICKTHDYLIDGRLVRVQTTDYIYHDNNSVAYFVSDCVNNGVIRFSRISEEEYYSKYASIIGEKSIQKVKTMI